MTSLIFLIYLAAMGLAWHGRRQPAMLVFAVATVAAFAWLKHHMTDPLRLGF